jgi:uridine kinase/catechol 2,3-dioxygenase-like lactoylglutathione lyase family enzyme
MAHIIGISGVSGAGKTVLTHALGQKLQSTVLHWDDFDDVSKSPEDYVDWYKRGQNYKEWDYKALSDVLQTLKSGASTRHPVSSLPLISTEYIVFDAPLGVKHNQTGQYIDTCIHIDVPLDVSLSRRLIRDFKSNNKTKVELVEELEFYLSQSRPLFFDGILKGKAHLIVDGMLPIEQQVEHILSHLREPILAPIKGINHITLAVKDIATSFGFYKNVLGFKPLCKWQGCAYFLLSDGLWFCLDRDRNRQPTLCSTHYAFSVSHEDFKAMSERIIKSGASIFKDNISPGDSLYFQDPDGHKLEIHVGDWQSRVAVKKANPGNWKNVEWFV